MTDLVAEIQQQLAAARDRVSQVRYGEVVVVIQDGRVVRIKVTESWQPGECAPPEKSANCR